SVRMMETPPPLDSVDPMIKEDIIERKDEPIDDLADDKQGKPLADISCSSAETSRPLNHYTPEPNDKETSRSKASARMMETPPAFDSVEPPEIVEDIIERKDEPIDDLADFNQQKPYADITCSSIEAPRPLNPSTSEESYINETSTTKDSPAEPSEEHEKLLDIEKEEVQPVTNDLTDANFTEPEQEEARKPIADISTGTSQSLDQSTPSATSVVPSKRKHLHRCVVCLRRGFLSEMRSFTSNHTKRKTWINAVRWTPEGRRSLLTRISTMTGPVLCSSHFSSYSFILRGNRLQLRDDAVPFYWIKGQSKEDLTSEMADVKQDEP
ncbi:hypothetical protein PMAYCL1PPCAC_27868, partial [Pristionchus mayeri]